LKNGDDNLKFGLEILVLGYEAWKEEHQGMCPWSGSELGPLCHIKSKKNGDPLFWGEWCAFINEKIASILVLFKAGFRPFAGWRSTTKVRDLVKEKEFD
jgi:hypothetical protein